MSSVPADTTSQTLTQRARSLAYGVVTTTDHKIIGLCYIACALFFMCIGGVEALLIRAQLASPEGGVLSPEAYNRAFTMHGTTMVFLVGMPMLIGLGNYVVPLMIGARDVAFPRLNAFAFWILPVGGFLLNFSFVVSDGAPSAGWFAYAPLNTPSYNLNHGIDYWLISLLILGIGSVAGGVNLIATILCMRAPGMSMQRIPLFCWMMGVTAVLLILAIPALNSALVMLLGDRALEAAFFQPARGGSALLWQHLFWIFGHPEVYILVLPAFGVISEVIPVFSRKPIYGYTFVMGSTIAIGLLSFGVWAHHMFAVGLGSPLDIFFAIGSMLIAIPTGIKIFNWTATMWGGRIQYTTAMCFAIAFLFQFIFGGLSGIMFAAVPADWQLTDTYFVVAHFHYVLFGGTIFAVMAAIYYWFPKVSGRMLSERLGKVQFWLMVVGFNMTFLVMHALGLMGMPRRTYTYAAEARPGWAELNAISSAGSLILGIGTVLIVPNIIRSLRKGERAGPNPWGAFTAEWLTPSPPPTENFVEPPVVRSRRPAWDEAHPDRADWKTAPTPEDTGSRPSRLRTGILAFIASEAMFFLLLLASFLVFTVGKPTSDTHALLNLPRTGVFTGVLLASSVTVWIAERLLRAGRRGAGLGVLALTIALGAGFLVNQGFEWAGLIGQDVSMHRGLFSALFFTITGFHGAHVFAGLVLLVIAATAGRGRSRLLGTVSLYWHFVDVVWIAVFSIIYLGALQ